MFRMGGAAVVAATLFVAVSGSAMLAAADPASTVLAQAPDTAAQDEARQECIRGGGWYESAVGTCEYEARAKAAALQSDEKTCEQNGGYWERVLGFCEFEAKDKAKQ